MLAELEESVALQVLLRKNKKEKKGQAYQNKKLLNIDRNMKQLVEVHSDA